MAAAFIDVIEHREGQQSGRLYFQSGLRRRGAQESSRRGDPPRIITCKPIKLKANSHIN